MTNKRDDFYEVLRKSIENKLHNELVKKKATITDVQFEIDGTEMATAWVIKVGKREFYVPYIWCGLADEIHDNEELTPLLGMLEMTKSEFQDFTKKLKKARKGRKRS